jgi:hypothetical protein
MVFRHTYWMAQSGHAAGELKDNEALVSALRALFESSVERTTSDSAVDPSGDSEMPVGSAKSRHTVMDGASVWCTEDQRVELRVITAGVSRRPTDPAVYETFQQWMVTA